MASMVSRSEVMKRNSRALITAAIRKRGTMSRVQLAKATSISRTHVSDVVDELIRDGTLLETGSVSSKPGRPQVMLQINPNGPSVAGVWLSEEAVHISVASADGKILAQSDVAYESCTDSSEHAVAGIAEGIRQCASRADRKVESLQGVGVAVSGYIEPLLRVIKRTRLNPCFLQLPLGKMLSDEMNVPVHIESDIRASALSHNWYCEGEDAAFYVWFLDGIGAAYVTDQQLFGAGHNMAPSVGHMIVAPDGPLCQCGRRGCLETFATASAFIRHIWPDLDPDRMSTRARHEHVWRGMSLTTQGDLAAIRALEATVEYMALGIANTINLFDPQVVYVGGLLIDHSPEMMMDFIRREAMKNINRSYQGVEIKMMPDIGEFVMRGALDLVLLHPYRVLQEINSRMLQLNSEP